MATYRGDEVPEQPPIEQGRSLFDRVDRPDGESLGPEAGADYEPKPGQKHYQEGDHEAGQTGNRESWRGARAENVDVQKRQDAGESSDSKGLQAKFKNLLAADDAMKLTDQEQNLYHHHLNELENGGFYHKDGSVSTIYSIDFTNKADGRTYMVPTVYDGHILPPDEAIDVAKMHGLDHFPSYPDSKTANERYQLMHNFMDRDVGAHLSGPQSRTRPSDADRPGGLLDADQ